MHEFGLLSPLGSRSTAYITSRASGGPRSTASWPVRHPEGPALAQLEAAMTTETQPAAAPHQRSGWSGAEARGFEPRMGVNPNRISSPFAAAKTAVSRPRLTKSAQVSGVAERKASEPGGVSRKSCWAINGPSRNPVTNRGRCMRADASPAALGHRVSGGRTARSHCPSAYCSHRPSPSVSHSGGRESR
jgi:hypothetical protein